jgi:hypothetical protein
MWMKTSAKDACFASMTIAQKTSLAGLAALIAGGGITSSVEASTAYQTEMNNGIVNTASRVTRYMDNIVVG